MNTSDITERVSLGSGYNGVVRMLSWKQLAEVREARSNRVLARAAKMTPEALAAIPDSAAETARVAAETDPLQGMDLEDLLRFGVVTITDPEGQEVYKQAAEIEDSYLDGLNEPDALKLGEAVASLSTRTEAEGED